MCKHKLIINTCEFIIFLKYDLYNISVENTKIIYGIENDRECKITCYVGRITDLRSDFCWVFINPSLGMKTSILNEVVHKGMVR